MAKKRKKTDTSFNFGASLAQATTKKAANPWAGMSSLASGGKGTRKRKPGQKGGGS